MNKVHLKGIAVISSGQGAPQGEKYFTNEGHPFIRVGSLELLLNGNNEDSLEKVNDETANKYKLRLYPKGTILFAKSSMSSTKDRGYMIKKACYVVNHLATIIPSKKIDSAFLTYWLRLFRPSRLIKDKSYPSIRLSDIEEVQIPLPPLPTQRKIASILEKAESAREKRKQANHLTDEFLKSAFLEMFGDPIRNSKGWKICEVKDVAANEKHSIKAGPFGSSLKKEYYVKKGYKIYGQEQVIRDDLTFGDYYISEEKYKTLESNKIKEGDILISLVGTFGKISVVPKKFEPGIINPRLMKITLNKKLVIPIFLKFLIVS